MDHVRLLCFIRADYSKERFLLPVNSQKRGATRHVRSPSKVDSMMLIAYFLSETLPELTLPGRLRFLLTPHAGFLIMLTFTRLGHDSRALDLTFETPQGAL